MNRTLLYFSVLICTLFFGANLHAQITTFPYSQDFETFANCGGNCASTCTLQDNWVNAATASSDFSVDDNGTSSSLTGPSVDHNPGTSGGKYLYAESSSPCFPTSSWHLLSPTIDLTGTNEVQFAFWYHMYGQSMGMAHVDVSEDGGTTWTLDVVPAWTDDQDLWQQQVVSLSAFTGIVTVRIRYENPSNYYGDFAIDDVLIYDLLQNDAGISAFVNPVIPACNFNDSVSVELMNYGTDTLTSVNIDWTLNAIPQTQVNWTGAIAAGGSDIVYLGNVSFVNSDVLTASTDLPNGIAEMTSGAGNDASSLTVQEGLNGSYVIGSTGTYLTLNSAISDLNSYGVCGPVVFEIEDGTYNEQLVLGSIIGMNAVNTVTFRSQSGDPSLTTISYAGTLPTENYVIAFNESDYFIFENLTIENTGTTYGRVLDFQGGSDWNTIQGCYLITTNVTTTSTNVSVVHSASGTINNSCSFIDNVIEGGSYGVYWYGGSTTSLSEGVIFDGNELLNNYYYGSRFYYVKDLVFTNNRTYGETTYTGTRFANYFYYSDGSFVITNNEIYGTANSGWYYGIYLGQCDGNNAQKGLVANNLVQVGTPGTTSTMYGIYLTNSGFVDIHSNNVLVSDGGASSRAFYATSGGVTQVKNNIFANYTDGYGVYLASSFSISEMDYNNIYSPAGKVGYYNTDLLTMTDWQSASSFDNNSLNVDPQYFNDFDLHLCNDSLKSAGISHPEVAMDIDGQPRSNNPDIGADEFTALNSNFLGNDFELCAGDVVTLSAGAPSDTILWSTGDTTLMIDVNTAGTYFVSINGTCGVSSDTVDVSMSNDVYTDFLTASDTLVCEGDSVVLGSSMMADTYTWSTAETTPTISVNTSGVYTLDISDNCGSGNESVNVTILSAPVAGYTHVGSYYSAAFTNASTGDYSSVLWDFGDGSTSTSDNPSHIFTTAGPHTVTLTVTNDCGTDTYSSIVSMVGLYDLVSASLTVFPNPTSDFLSIQGIDQVGEIQKIEVLSTMGQLILSVNEFKDALNVSTLPSGVYFLNVVHAKGSETIKFIKE